jgi:hypothetical protein
MVNGSLVAIGITLMLANAGLARAVDPTLPAPHISLFNEENGRIAGIGVNRIQSWCSTVVDPTIDPSNKPLNGATVRFELLNFSMGSSFSFEGGGTTKTVATSGCGFACVAATGTSASGTGSCTIRATYVKPDGTDSVSQEGTIGLISSACTSNTSPDPVGTWGPFRDANGNPNSFGLTYRIETTHFVAESQQAFGNWNASGLASFTPIQTGTPNILIKDVIEQGDTSYARAPQDFDVGQPNYREIHINLEATDPCPRNPENSLGAGTLYPPASARHHMVCTMAHEIGHCLNLLHTDGDVIPPLSPDLGALMWTSPANWFVCGTDSPTWDEQQGMENNGY